MDVPEFDLHGAVVVYPGDTIAFYTSTELTSEAMDRFMESADDLFPDCRVALMSGVSGAVVYRDAPFAVDLPLEEEGDTEGG